MTFEQKIKLIGYRQNIDYACPLCKQINTMTKRQYMKRVYKCPSCEAQQKQETRIKEVTKALKEKGFIALEAIETKKYHEIIKVRCLHCDRETTGTISNLLRDRKKCNCNPDKQFKTNITQEEFLEKVSIDIKKKFNILGEYNGRNSLVAIECKQCHSIRESWASTLIDAKDLKCVCESRSKGEAKIYSILTNIGITKIEEQYKIPTPSRKYSYRLDFYIPEYKIGIEYQGEQHYQVVEFFGGEEKLILQQERDKNKSQYCFDNGIELLVFSYKDSIDKIENTLREVLERSTTSRKA